MCNPKGFDILQAIKRLKAYDKEGNVLGEINGGTSYRNFNEQWTARNTEVFVDEKEIPLRDIYFNEEEVQKKIANWELEVYSIQQKLSIEKNIREITFHAKDIVTIHEWTVLLKEHTKNKLVFLS